MAKGTINNVKLGVFVLGGLLFLVLLLYMIGKNQHLFGSTYKLRAHFEHVQGLVPGNNVRYSGIEAGTVKQINILNDTLIEVNMVISRKMQGVIRKNAVVSIGSEGLVGNKVVNIVPARQPAALAQEGDILVTRKTLDTEDMLQTLGGTNKDVAIIAQDLKETVNRLNNSQALWRLLNDTALPRDIRLSAAHIRSAAANAGATVNDLHELVTGVREGKGTLGILLTDTLLATNLNAAAAQLKSVGDQADSLAVELQQVVSGIHNDMDSGKGAIHLLLKDTLLAIKLQASLDNIEKGTAGFNENMEAMKHNFLLRGYFKKQEKKQRKEESRNTAKEE